MNRRFFVFSIFLVLAVLMISSISALGVTPGRKIVNFVSNGEIESSFRIINSESRALNLKISLNGDLSSGFLIGQKEVSIGPGEEKEVSYKLKLPESVEPGTHIQEIVIEEIPGANGGSIGATVGVITQLYVKKSYPGKYAQVEFNIESAEQSQEVLFSLPVFNLGEENLDEVSAKINVYDSKGESVAIISSGKIGVAVDERKEISAGWKADVAPGVYTAKAVVSYDGKSENLEKSFTIGEKVLDLVNVNVKGFSIGGIAKFEMSVENKWSSDIKGVYSQTTVFGKDQNMIVEFKSPTEDIPALSNHTFFSYWDTEGLDIGLYNATIYLKYGEKFSKKNVQFNVGADSIETIGLGYSIYGSNPSGSNGKMNILIIIIVVLVLINVLWFIAFRKKLKQK